MRRSVITAIALVSLFLFSAEVGMSQAPNSGQVNVNAVHALWLTIKKQLTGPNGEEYFTNFLENADLPLLIGTLISATPEGQPTTLVLAMSDGTTPEVTPRFEDDNGKESHINGPLMRGSQIQFEGIPVAFTKDPFMLTFGVTTGPKLSHAAVPNLTPKSK
jgi:hypothetical protein